MAGIVKMSEIRSAIQVNHNCNHYFFKWMMLTAQICNADIFFIDANCHIIVILPGNVSLSISGENNQICFTLS